ncbi:uncharacterized protein LOC124613729 [Schistocerca americana]|uniref:uncharacterized protein LOC124613729 n=1 Tax=Schistocerca americana TaxID=7009 RepID=UPI001F4FA53F|nr:uncharacterized protein LOC124613729 [Schistocerca americana]
MVLHSYGLEDIINGTRERVELLQDAASAQKEAYVEWHKDDAKAASLIASALSKPVAELVLTFKNAKEMWDKLRARFERSSTQRLNMLIEAFFRIKRDETENISAHVAKLQKLFVDLNDEFAKREENTLSERILNGRILSTLGKDYENFKVLWDTIPTEKQSLNLLIEKHCTIELRERDITGSAGFVVSKTRKRQTSNQQVKMTKSQLKQKFPCDISKQLGHWAAECPQNTRDSNKRKEKKRESEHAAFTSYAMGVCTSNHSDPNKCYCDSGATNHITPSKQYFVSYCEFDAPQVVSLGKQDVKMCAYSQGAVYIQIRRNNKWYNARMDNGLYVTDASANLFSVRATAWRGYSTNFSYNNVCVRKQVSGNIVMTGYAKNGLYVLNMRVVRNAKMNHMSLMTSSETLQVYHETFGHQNKQHAQSILKEMYIYVEDAKSEFSDNCAVG